MQVGIQRFYEDIPLSILRIVTVFISGLKVERGKKRCLGAVKSNVSAQIEIETPLTSGRKDKTILKV